MRHPILAGLLLLTTGCSAMFNGSSQRVLFTSNPPGATVKVRGADFTTPFEVSIPNRSARYTASLEGYETESAEVPERFAGAFIISFFTPYWLGVFVDLASSAVTIPVGRVHVNFRPTEPSQ